MKNIFKENIKFFIIIFFTVLVSILISNHVLNINNKAYAFKELGQSDGSFTNIKKGDVIEQKITATDNNFSKLKIYFEIPDNTSGKAKIQLKDEEGQILKEADIVKNNLQPYYELSFKAQKESKNKNYIISITFEDTINNKDMFGVQTMSGDEKEHFTINNEGTEKSLVFQDYYYKPHKMLIYTLATIGLVICTVSMASYIYFKKNIKPEKILLVTVPIIGLFYIIAMPTYKSHDELYHWYRAYEVSIGAWNEGIDENGELGTEMPEVVENFMHKNHHDVVYADFKDAINSKIDNSNQTKIYSVTQAVYSFVSYIPQAIGIFITRIFTDSALLIAYGGRIMNLIFSIAFMYFAIKHIPFGKNIVLLISYIPIALEGFASLSADALTISISILYIAEILRFAYTKKENFIGTKHLVFLTIMSVVVALCKIVYIPLVLLMIIIPSSKFKNGKKWGKIITVMLIAIVINLLWLKKASGYLTYFKDGDSKYQVINILGNPIRYIQIMFYTLNNELMKYYSQMFGRDLGWGEFVELNYLVPIALGTVSICTIVADNNMKPRLNKLTQIIVSLVVLAIVALIFTSLYVQWTSVNSDQIAGIQGRYFIPILPLITIMIGCNLKKIKSNYNTQDISKLVGITGTMVQIFSILQIVIFNV